MVGTPPSSCSGFRSTVNTRPRAQPEIDNRIESFGTGLSWAEGQLNDAAKTITVATNRFMLQAYRHLGVPTTRTLRRGGRDTRRWIQLWRPWAARPHAGRERAVLELTAVRGTAQHQPASAHVAAADECRRVAQAIAENRQQHIHVLPAGHATQ